MRKLCAAFPVFAIVAVAAPAGAQEAASTRPFLHQSGCEVLAEFMSCLNFGEPPEEAKSTVRNLAAHSDGRVSIKLDATSEETPLVGQASDRQD